MAAPATIVMKLTGPVGMIEGECVVEGYEKRIVIEDWKWNLNASKDKLKPSQFSLSKLSDRASVPMLKVLQACEVCPTVEVLVEEDAMDSHLELKIILTDARILSFKLSGKVDDKGGTLEEDWEFSYEKIKFEYRSYGSKQAKPKTVPFEIEGDPQGMESPGSVEDKILKLVPEVKPDRLKELFKQMETASQQHAQRKLERTATGDKEDK